MNNPTNITMDLQELLTTILNKQLVGTLVILIGALIISAVIKKVIKKLFKLHLTAVDEKRQKTLESLLINVTKYAVFVIALIMLLELYGFDITTLLASFGILGLVVGLALQDTARDFISGFSIIFEDQYRVGDNVTIGNFRGDVKTLGLKTTVLRSRNGEIKSIANRNIMEVINHSRESARETISLTIAQEADASRINEILTELAEKLTNELPELAGPIKNYGVNNMETSNVVFLMSFKTTPLQQEDTKRAIIQEIKNVLDKEGHSQWIKSIA